MILEAPVPAEALAAIRAPFLALDAELIDTPIIQPLALLLDLAGETMRARLFVVQGEGGEEACLRPDFTLPLARVHMASGEGEGRYIYEGKAFRVAPHGSGRAEEFLQIGLEAYGAGDGPAVDAEIAALAWSAAVAGGREDLTMTLGDVALFGAFIDGMGLSPLLAQRLKRAFSRPGGLRAELSRAQDGAPEARQGLRQGARLASLLAGLPEAEAATVLEELWALADIQPVGGRKASEIVHRLTQRAEAAQGPGLSPAQAELITRFLDVAEKPRAALGQVAKIARAARADMDAALEAWSRRLAVLLSLGAPEDRLILAAGFGRTFSYYDGFMFEVRSADLGPDSPVAGGGRYDSLPVRLGGEDACGAVGCMVRPARAWVGGEVRL